MTRVEGPLELEQGDAVALLACQTDVLELMSGGAALPVMLDCITGGLERLMPESRCSLLLLDPATGALRHGSAPNLPQAYLTAIDGLVPGPDEGSCGTAAYLCEQVVVADITVDERWDRYRASALAAGLRACWSSPVVGSSGAVVGTFAVYHCQPREPTAREQRIVDRLTYLASVAIEHAAMFGALTVSEGRFRRAFEDNAVAMALLDTDGRFTRVNAAMRQLTGPGESVSAALIDVVEAGERARLAGILGEVRAGRLRSAHAEVRLGWREAVVSLTMSLVRGAQGEPVQVSVSMLDITERLAAQRERRARHEAELAQRSAEAASHAKSAFLSAVSHEMRTPLQAITGFAELLGTLDLDPDRRREALRHIATGAAHLLELVDDTLDLSRIEADALPLAIVPVPVTEIVAEVVDFLAPVAGAHAVALLRGPTSGAVLADRRRLRQVLTNLVSNGIRYSGSGGVVRVEATPDGAAMRVMVADNGPGIDADLRERLFEPFVRFDAAERQAPASGDGIGLGLMLARGLTEAMRGQLTLADAPGGGTVASVVLPRVSGA